MLNFKVDTAVNERLSYWCEGIRHFTSALYDVPEHILDEISVI